MSYNVLLVDDSSVVRKVLKKTFALSGVAVGSLVEAENGKVALDKLKEGWFDVVFLDINMPVMNGIEFVRSIRSSEDYRNLPVVIVSTEGAQERIDELRAAGVQHYLRKPVSPEQLAATITEVFGELPKHD
jgi:two-component system chemotaxis response regulator CheY